MRNNGVMVRYLGLNYTYAIASDAAATSHPSGFASFLTESASVSASDIVQTIAFVETV